MDKTAITIVAIIVAGLVSISWVLTADVAYIACVHNHSPKECE